MSTDAPETEYSAGTSNVLHDGAALTDEAIRRYRERTPHDNTVGIRNAYERGENIEHPAVVRAPWQDIEPERARVYTHAKPDGAHDWTIVFLVVENDIPPSERLPQQPCDYVVATAVDIDTFEHGPSRAYLHSHGPHGGASE